MSVMKDMVIAYEEMLGEDMYDVLTEPFDCGKLLTFLKVLGEKRTKTLFELFEDGKVDEADMKSLAEYLKEDDDDMTHDFHGCAECMMLQIQQTNNEFDKFFGIEIGNTKRAG